MTGGNVLLKGARPEHLQAALDILGRTGVNLTVESNGLRVQRNGNGIQAVDAETDPFPGFPTDLQAQFMALMTMSSGTSHIRETIFENR
ncbi:UDP-N-acetylglucosamine 1-carboxyvinyltransferase, partial [Pseudoxanthomonas sp. KAs_5_3]